MKKLVLMVAAIMVLAGCVNPYLGDVDAEDVVTIDSIRITHVNSVWLTYIGVEFTNQLTDGNVASDTPDDASTIKYVRFEVSAYNAVGDRLREDIWDYDVADCKLVGPIGKGESKSDEWEIGYFTNVDYVVATLSSVTMMDDAFIYAEDPPEVSSR